MVAYILCLQMSFMIGFFYSFCSMIVAVADLEGDSGGDELSHTMGEMIHIMRWTSASNVFNRSAARYF